MYPGHYYVPLDLVLVADHFVPPPAAGDPVVDSEENLASY